MPDIIDPTAGDVVPSVNPGPESPLATPPSSVEKSSATQNQKPNVASDHEARIQALESQIANISSQRSSCGAGGGGGGSGGGGFGAGSGGAGGEHHGAGTGESAGSVVFLKLNGAPSNVDLQPGPAAPQVRHQNGKGARKRKDPITAFVLHETAGKPRKNAQALIESRVKSCNKAGSGLTTQCFFWNTQNGSIMQTIQFWQQSGCQAPTNWYSMGIELGGYSRLDSDYTRNSKASTKRFQYMLASWPNDKCHFMTPEGYKLKARAPILYMLSEAQLRSAWDLAVWLHNGADGIQGSEWLDIDIAFPATDSEEYFKWSSWKEPSWWKSTARRGIHAHHNHGTGHGDGDFASFYCLGRAQGMSSEEAYYSAVGAISTMGGEKAQKTGFGSKTTRWPNSSYVQIGRDIMQDAPLTIAWGDPAIASGEAHWIGAGSGAAVAAAGDESGDDGSGLPDGTTWEDEPPAATTTETEPPPIKSEEDTEVAETTEAEEEGGWFDWI